MSNNIDIIVQGTYNDYTGEIVRNYLNLDFVNRIIISCWENDIVNLTHDKICILQSKDVKYPGLTNRNRQIKSSYEGLKLATSEFSVKLRSDQKISLDSMKLMYNFYNNNKEQELCFSNGLKPKNKICVAGIFKPFPFHPRDHIFWGNTQDLIDVFNIPYDNISINEDYTKYVRSEAYICMWYYARFDKDIERFINNPTNYLVDNAPLIKEALLKSDFLGPKIFKPFPRIDFAWPKHGLNSYHYNLTASQFGEYWDN